MRKEESVIRIEYLKSKGLDHNDFDAWRQKYSNKKGDSKGYFELTFQEYIDLAVQAGLKFPKEIGQSTSSFCLGRIGDVGPYSIDNCRFITNRQNHDEKMINGGSKRGGIKLSKYRNQPEIRRKSSEFMYNNNPSKTDPVKKLLSESWHKQLESGNMILDANKGKHWYNNGTNELMTFQCPEGWDKGRILKKNKL